ncbi:MAG: EAL domain-containing protein [Candidatus Omnitrophica bacterium]|nr:EAL domain-containing protein [Candidatus Omnitrophota bacterium]
MTALKNISNLVCGKENKGFSRFFLPSLFLPSIIFFFGTSFTISFFLETQKNALSFAKHYFERSANLRCDIISEQLKGAAADFDSLRRFFGGTEFVNRKEFNDFIQPFLGKSDTILETFWVSKVSSLEKDSFEDRWDTEHGSFVIHDMTPDGRSPVSQQRSVYYPITLIAPLEEKNASSLGLDLGASQSMQKIFDAASQKAGQTLFFPSPWAFAKDEEGSYLLIAAVLAEKHELDPLPAETIAGYAAMILSPSGIAKAALKYPLAPGLTIKIYDVSASPESLLFQIRSLEHPSSKTFDFLYPQSSVYMREIPILDRKFSIAVEASTPFFVSFFFPVYWIFLPLGILLSFLSALYIRRAFLQQKVAERFAEERTHESEAKEYHLMTTLQSIGEALITTNVSGHITRMNTIAEQLTGWSAQEATGRPLKEIFCVLNESTRMPLMDPVEKVLLDGNILALTNHTLLISRDGKEFPIENKSAPIKDDQQRIIGVILIFRDVTETRMTARALEDSEKKFRSFFANMQEGVAMHRVIYGRNGLAVNYMITDVNPRYEEILGLPRERVIGKLATDVYGTTQPPYLNEFIRPLETGQPSSLTVYFEPMKKHFLVSIISFSPGTFATVFSDISEARKAEEALKTREAYLSAIFDNFPHIAWLKDPQGRFLAVNETFARSCNKPNASALNGLTDFDIWPKELAERYVADDLDVIATRRKKFVEEPVLDHGSIKWFETYKTPILDGNGNILGTTGFGRDITDRKASDNIIQESKKRLERASEAGRVALWERSLIDGKMTWSNFVNSMLGLTPEESLHTVSDWEKRIHADDLIRVKHLFEQHLKDNGPYDTVYRMKKSDGTYAWWHDIGLAQRNKEGIVEKMSGACVDISEQRLAQEELQKLVSVIHCSTEMIYLATLEGGIVFLNDAGSQMLGIEPEEMDQKTIFDVIPEHLTTKFKNEILPTLIRDSRWEGDSQCRHLKTGSLTDVHTLLFTLVDPETQQPLYLANISLDITQRKLAEQNLAQERELLRILIDNIPDSIYVKDIGGRKILANRADLDFMGVKNERDILGKTDADFYPAHLAEQYSKDDQAVLQSGRPVINREEVIDGTSGGLHWLLTTKLPFRGPDGLIKGLIGIGRDVTDRKFLENKLLTMAHYDMLTTLPNRTLFLEKANTGLAKARRNETMCAVLFIDLDLFKSVNDTLGHSVGDELLKDTAFKLTECIRESDTLARLGGDEFIVFLTDLEDGQFAQQIAERIREKFNNPRIISGNDLFITASIGIAVSPNDGDTFEELLKNADTAMYAAKDAGRNNFCFFNSIMNQKAVTKMQIERGLREALSKDELSLSYQPIVSVKDGKILGFEALLRWNRKEGGLVFPDEFIPVAEETGLIVPMGEWVLYRACQFNKKLSEAGYPGLSIAVNISVTQLRRTSILDTIKNALKDNGLPPESLEIEVTESILIESFEAAVDILKQIQALGVKIALDDFGTGYSSLSHLQHLPISRLKIDRLFIKNISQETEENDLTESIIALAHKLKLSVVAEGVEIDSQLNRLKSNHCDYFQGYLLSKPIEEAKVIAFLNNYHPQKT